MFGVRLSNLKNEFLDDSLDERHTPQNKTTTTTLYIEREDVIE
jgi:hypothetical protein